MWSTYFEMAPWNPMHWMIPVNVDKDLADANFGGSIDKFKD